MSHTNSISSHVNISSIEVCKTFLLCQKRAGILVKDLQFLVLGKIHLKNRDISTLKAYGFNQILADCNTDFDTQKAAMLDLISNAPSSEVDPILGMRHFIQYFGVKDEIDFDNQNRPILSDEQYQTMLLRLFSERDGLATSPIEIDTLEGNITQTYIEIYDSFNRLDENTSSINLHEAYLILLPNNFSHLVNLKELNLSENFLESLPPEIAALGKLETLNMNVNECKIFPEVICSLKNLKTLSLMANELNSLPPEVEQLRNLESLNLDFNNFTTFPEVLLKLTKLTTLLMVDNFLETLPAGINQLSQLKSLILADNQKMEIPEEILELENLEKLDINPNFDPENERTKYKGKSDVRNALIKYFNQK